MPTDLGTSVPHGAQRANDRWPVWSDQPGIETVGGVPFRMYPHRPRHLLEVLSLARRWGERTYVVQRDRTVTFAGLLAGSARKARLLADSGIKAQDRILIFGWNSPDWIVNFWAAQALGAVPVLANAWWSRVELDEAVALLQPTAVLADAPSRVPSSARQVAWDAPTDGVPDDEVADLLRTPVDHRHDESGPAVIIFTSGTAGRPKAVELSHRALLANLQMLLQMTRRLPQQLEHPAGEVALHTGPLFHVGGSQTLMRTVALGNTIVLPSGRFDPADVLELIERHRITRWSAVPTMVGRVLEHADLQRRDVSSLTSLTIGGSPIHAELLQRIGSELRT